MAHHLMFHATRPLTVLLALLPLAGGCAVHARGAVSTTVAAPAQPVVVASQTVVTPQSVVVTAPPPARPSYAVVVNPAPRQGHHWVAGHYAWTAGGWAWQTGRWISARPGYAYVSPRFDPVHRVWIRGHWARRPLRAALRVAPTPPRAVVHVRAPRSPHPPRPVVRVRPQPPRVVVHGRAHGRVVVRRAR
jgi:hypothetical protein